MKIIKECGIPVILRLDPIIPFLTENEALRVLEKCDFVDHVVTSTLKLRKDILSRFSKVFPDLANIYRNIYTERFGNYMYLQKDIRIRILKQIEKKCNEFGISCAFCREGIPFKAKSCDGTHLILS